MPSQQCSAEDVGCFIRCEAGGGVAQSAALVSPHKPAMQARAHSLLLLCPPLVYAYCLLFLPF